MMSIVKSQEEIRRKAEKIQARLDKNKAKRKLIMAEFEALRAICKHPEVDRWTSIDQSSNMRCRDCGYYEG